MADTTINLQLVLSGKGIKATGDKIKTVNVAMEDMAKKTNKASNAQNKLKRNLDGTAQRTGNTTKDFARQAQGLGGLVQAYATIAANVFALSSAFLVLRRSADLQSMIKSAENFSDRFGVSVTRITKQMQEASGGALSFADALPIVNKAVSAGIPIEKMERLTEAATKAAQTFGGTTTEALNRFISASQRGRVEIIQTLGIVIKTEQAYKDYAAQIGKTAQELTAYDRQQAILNATINESENIFDKIIIDPNPFQRLATTISDLKDTILGFATNVLTPFLNFFNQSQEAGLVLIAVLTRMVGGRIFPVLGEQMQALQKQSVASTSAALAAARKSRSQLAKFEASKGKAIIGGGDPTKQLKKAEDAFRKSLGTRISLHKDFADKIVKQDGTINEKALNAQRGALQRTINARKKGQQGFKIFAKQTTAELEKQLAILTAVGSRIDGNTVAQKKAAAATAQTTTAMKSLELRTKAVTTQAKATRAQFTSLYVTGKARAFLGVQENLIKTIGDVGRAWGKFAKDVATFNGTGVITSFGRAAGRTIGFISGAFQKLFGVFTAAIVIWQIGQFVWEKWGDTILGITPQQRAMTKAAEEFKEEMGEINKRTVEGIVKLGQELPESLKKLQDALKFTAGTFDSISNALSKLQAETRTAFGNLSTQEAIARVRQLREEIIKLRVNTLKSTRNNRLGFEINPVVTKQVAELEDELKGLEAVLDSIATRSITQFNIALSQSSELAKKVGFEQVGQILIRELESLNIDIPGEIGVEGLKQAFASLDLQRIKSELEAIGKIMGEDSEQFITLSDSLLQLAKNFSGTLRGINIEIDQSLGRLSDVNNRITTFIGGLDKLRSASGPNKELIGFALDINRELSALNKIQNSIERNKRLSEIFGNPQELAQVKAFLGFAADQVVSVAEAQERAARVQGVLQQQQQARLIVAEELKVLQIDQQEIASRVLETDSDRLIQIKDELKVQKEILTAKKELALADVNAQRAVLAAQIQLKASEAQIQLERAKLRVYEAQFNALVNQEETLSKSTKLQVEATTIVKERIDEEQAIAKTQLETSKVIQRNTGGMLAQAKATTEQFNLQKKINRLAIIDLEVQMARVEYQRKRGEASQREVDLLEAQLQKQRAINAEFEKRQGLLEEARRREAEGVSVFSEEGLELSAKFFVQKINDEAKKLKTTFEILGEGFADTVNGAIDTAITNLLEGGKDFGETLREAIKASLRDVIGEAISSRIKEAFAEALNLPTEAAKAEAREQATVNRHEEWKLRQEANTLAVDELRKTIASGACCKPGSGGEITMETATTNNPLKALDETFGNVLNAEINPLQNLLKTGNESADKAIAEAVNSREGIIGTLLQLGSMLVSAIFSSNTASSGGGIFSALSGIFTGGVGAKDGAVFKGGIKAFADGGYVTKPTLGLVGEGNRNEAVVPLPNNREIPVEMRGGGDTINIEQNFDFTNATADAVPQLRAEARAIEERTFNRVFSEINRGGRYAKIAGRR